ncbi:protein LONGIFOLIA 1-like [Panicum miliaceum]|uniref:Protein LONGIFOLIA 1-like n=1 Tax=Panicum miliaceum TaxID=4540 RepID=A0A3L6TJN3_PANMI|nr:protein LONGIFOLIA 1-like [Panicum miliaceum]
MAAEFSQDVKGFDRHMGCMAGMFQIFDRRRLLSGRQRGGSPGIGNELLPGHDLAGSSMHAPLHCSANPNTTPEKSFSKSTTENSILSTETSRATSSSSFCSSMSSLDGSKPVQQELSYILNEEPVVGRTVRSSQSLKSSNKEVRSKQGNTDFRDAVKDSIKRDSGVLAIKRTTMAQRNGSHKDSPRPLLVSKSKDGTYMIAVDRSSGLPAYVGESRRQPCFSCDDRQMLQQAEAQDSQMPSSKLRELPRLSLDSRKESVRPSSHLKNFGYAKADDSLIDNLKSQESPGHRRASSVIAKLMGLEETLDSPGPARSHRQAHDIQNGHPSHTPRSIYPDPSVSQPMVQPPILKTKASARIVPEAAPLKQQERGITRYNDEARPRSASTYNDMERRLRHLALSECNKDLRALRILGNLHAKHTPCQRDYNARLLPIQKATAEGNNTTAQDLQSPVVIIKPARGIMRPNTLVASLAGPKVHRKLQHEERAFTRKSDSSDRKKTHSHHGRVHYRAEEAVGITISPKPSRSLSPRLVQKKSDCGRIPRLSVPPMSPGKTPDEVVSPRGRLRSRAAQANNICREDKMSMIAESRISLSKHVDMGIIDYPNLNVNTSCSHQSNTVSKLNNEETLPILSSNKKNIHPLENIPSPISVLDATFYQDGLAPSLRNISNSFQDVSTHTLDECWNPVSLPDTPILKKNCEGDHILPKNMTTLIQKLELLQLLSDEAPSTNDNLLMDTANKDRHYIYEILSASGLLHSELGSRMMPYQFQLPSYPINPGVFLILEQAKPAAGKLHRKLIFDLTNELIAQKIHIGGSVRQPLQLFRCKKSSGLHLFKELCSEIEILQSEASILRLSEEEEEESKPAKNAVDEMGKWKSFDSELQGMVLDIERYIFKNLIDEVISGKAMRKV